MQNGEISYDNVLSQETNMNIDYAIENFRNKIKENSNMSSFSLPVREDSNTLKVNLPTRNTTQENKTVNFPTKGENVNYTEMQNPGDKKSRKFYKSVITSDNTTVEAKKI